MDNPADTTTEQNNGQGHTNGNGNGSRRKKLIIGVLGAFALASIASAVYWATVSRYVEYTDNAYVNGDTIQITPQVAGTVTAIGADDTQFVKAGQVLVQLDQADAEIALQRAESQLARAVRSVRNLYATSAQQQASLQARESDLAKSEQDVARRERLASSGAISKEEVQHARDAVAVAQSALAAARQQLAATSALVDHTTIEKHPEVQSAAAAVKDAYLASARTALPAPVNGFVAKRSVQLGQRVNPGAPLMAVIPLDKVWVDANFKEPQLAGIRIGQPATLKADVYGSQVEYHGHVIGIGAGTGGAFALLPAQNASGNWIKIVQRVPVRIELDAQELAAHPLQIGLSMQVDIDIHDRSGPRLPQVAGASAVHRTDVFHSLDDLAERRVREVIAANMSSNQQLAQHHRIGTATAGSKHL
jgi:membrane fusion protein (multidrug efflux system)